jgi:hypothetical protein
MGPVSIELFDSSIEIGLQLFNRAIKLLPKGDVVELVGSRLLFWPGFSHFQKFLRRREGKRYGMPKPLSEDRGSLRPEPGRRAVAEGFVLAAVQN